MVPALLFSAFGVIFLLTSAKMKVKRLVLWLFALSVMIHAGGMTARGHYPAFDNILIINSVILLLLIGYMCSVIYRAWGRERRRTDT